MGRGPNGQAAKRMRAALVERDGPGCAYCGSRLPSGGGRLEHVVPYSKGGPNHIDNRVLACERCDLNKRNRTPQEWRPGQVWGNPVIDSPTLLRRKVLAVPRPRPKKRAEQMVGGGADD